MDLLALLPLVWNAFHIYPPTLARQHNTDSSRVCNMVATEMTGSYVLDRMAIVPQMVVCSARLGGSNSVYVTKVAGSGWAAWRQVPSARTAPLWEREEILLGEGVSSRVEK